MSFDVERRIVIVGKTGNGKSSLGNNLLGKKSFDEGGSFNSVTETCNKDTKCDLTIVDTPGLFRPTDEKSMAQQSLEILKSLDICENPHAFLLVIRCDTRWSQEDLFTKEALEIIFGPEFFQHTIVVITHVDNNMTDTDLQEKLRGSEKVTHLIECCDKRVARIDNTNVKDDYITDILKYVKTVSKDGTRSYSYAFQGCNRQILEEIAEHGLYDGAKAHEQVAYISREIKKEVENEQFKTELDRKYEDLKYREELLFKRERALDETKIHADEMHQKIIDELYEMKRNAEEKIKYRENMARKEEAERARIIREAKKAEKKQMKKWRRLKKS